MLKLTVNGQSYEIASDPDTPLAYVLRNELKLKGTKVGCGLEQCGACSVLADGEAVFSCASPVSVFEGQAITTIEGISDSDEGKSVQAAFVRHRAAQCGYCTAGLVVKLTALAKANASGDRDALKKDLSEHLCRCGTHSRVLAAAQSILRTTG